eukprot:TRINITY_DN2680_c0_g1_i2.p1 TRINITY_DN2680_c0_g1~~TRINITY_DN2680_c0_g1_i2.p1  ORF type:complete len:171 (+),score=49.69 TRINITY_DN2680_c0_g1_i2:202-714(+)
MTTLHSNPDRTVSLVLFQQCKNTPAIKEKLLAGELSMALIKPELIVDEFQVLVAANQTVHLDENDLKKTRTLFTELIYTLSGGSKITNALKTFGIEDSSTEILCVLFDATEKDLKGLDELVDGERVELSELANWTDVEKVKSVYKIANSECKVNGGLLDAVVNRIAIKDC